jgi:hypothetical protein
VPGGRSERHSTAHSEPISPIRSHDLRSACWREDVRDAWRQQWLQQQAGVRETLQSKVENRSRLQQSIQKPFSVLGNAPGFDD